MTEKKYISVIIPLKLEWEPCYSLPESLCQESVSVGDRVKVKFANRMYSGVVSKIDIVPETALSKIKDIEEVENGLERINPKEINAKIENRTTRTSKRITFICINAKLEQDQRNDAKRAYKIPEHRPM